MTLSISSVLRDAARQEYVPDLLGNAFPPGLVGNAAYEFSWHYMPESFFLLKNEERSAFLYLCSLIAEDEHG